MQKAPDFTTNTSHLHSRALFSLWLSLYILSGAISPVFSSSILGTYQSGEFIFQCPPRGLRPHVVPPRCSAARAPVPAAGHWWPMPPQEMLKHSEAGLAQSLWDPGSWCIHSFLWALQASLMGMGLILNMISPLLPSCWGFPLPLDVGYLIFDGI